MNNVTVSRSLFAAAAAFLAAACSDPSLATAPVANSALSQHTASAVTTSGKSTAVSVLTRTKAIDDVTVSATIGSAGGSIIVPSAGFTLTVLPNAVMVNTTFSVHALAGTAVAYEFEPHGTVFSVKPIFEQDLSKTNMKNISFALLEGAYFASSAQVDGSSNTASVDQFFSTGFAVDGTLYFSLPHFSGYLVSSGRK